MPPKKIGTKRKAASQPINTLTLAAKEEAFLTAFYSESSSGDDEDDEATALNRMTCRGGLKKRRGHKPKRPKFPEPEASDLSDHETKSGKVELAHDGKIRRDVTLSMFADLHGREYEFKVNLSDILAQHNIKPQNFLSISSGIITHRQLPGTTSIKEFGFCDLPLELKVGIYREIFVRQNEPITFSSRAGFERSAQFLSTCRQVMEHGSVVLYGENSFHFGRVHETRGKYYEKVWKEIGFRDVRRFLHDIGPTNVDKLRYVSIEFDDSLPSYTPYLSQEQRKYFNDPVLIELLKMLGKTKALEQFAVAFRGRTNLTDKDYHFLKALCTIRCKQYVCVSRRYWARINAQTKETVRELIQLPADPNTTIDPARKKLVPKMVLDQNF